MATNKGGKKGDKKSAAPPPEPTIPRTGELLVLVT